MGMASIGRRRRVLILSTVVLIIAAGLWTLSHCNILTFGRTHEEKQTDIRDFLALPYLAHVEDDPNPEIKGVSLHNERLSYPGLNLLTSMNSGCSHLLDMKGNILHSWFTNKRLRDRWLYSEMDRDGNLIVIVTGFGLAKIDWKSDIIWVSAASKSPHLDRERRASYHHDFDVTESGEIYVLANEPRRVEIRSSGSPPQEIRDNSVIILTPEGVARRKVSFYDALGRLMAGDIVKHINEARSKIKSQGKVPTLTFDVFHSNAVEEIHADIGVAERGNVLFCIRNLNLIGILDIEKEELVWSWGPGVLQLPHDPTVLANGNILVFDNGLRTRGYSRVLELDPRTKEIVWKYGADPRESFFSPVMGASQRLPNGNTLITESTKGRVFEVTQDGEAVWEFRNFEVREKGENKGKRSTIYRMMRYDREFLRGSS
jgi:hypothetical protein